MSKVELFPFWGLMCETPLMIAAVGVILRGSRSCSLANIVIVSVSIIVCNLVILGPPPPLTNLMPKFSILAK
ncbi:hypothetical protein BC829DRAFT_397767 [Chytridium lagenaria]|nr:hypothetical protein BC829DRAFT_397767 [Chytridium lagenaria]